MKQKSNHYIWAIFRLGIIGQLLSSPPGRGELKRNIQNLSLKTWKNPVTGDLVKFGESTIERWYYKAINNKTSTVNALTWKERSDSGKSNVINTALTKMIFEQYKKYRNWSYKLHYDNLLIRIEKNSTLGNKIAYQTLIRFMKKNGLFKVKGNLALAGMDIAQKHLDTFEVRSFEVEYIGGLWHLDFHHGSIKIILATGQWVYPIALAIMDDCSRLGCHVQWYLAEDTKNLVHGFSQATQKRGLARSLMTDNGSAMISAEFTEGLVRLGIIHKTTLAYSPYQNGKQEKFWATLEGRLVNMIVGVKNLTLKQLNDFTLTWLGMEYNCSEHSEINSTPIAKYSTQKDVLRPSPNSEELRLAFRMEQIRTQRKTDGTISLDSVRFEIPSPYRHISKLHIHYARWDLSIASIVDEKTKKIICHIYPLDKTKNANGHRKPRGNILNNSINSTSVLTEELPPLMEEMINKQKREGKVPSYIPQSEEQ